MNRLTFGALSRRVALPATAFAAIAAFAPAIAAAETVNIYSYRQPPLIEPVLNAFTAKTGIETNVLFLDKGLDERIVAEGENSPADVILAVDIARLSAIVDKGITQPVTDEAINAAIPAEYRDPAGNWFGLTKRGRVIYASKDRVAQNEITYEELADPKWKGKICIRSGQHDYNLALISSLIAHNGAEKTEAWLEGVKANLARKPEGGDRDQAKAIFAGECDIAIGNTYYIGEMLMNEKEPEQKDWAGAVKVLFPNAADRGTHVNVSGMALAKYAPNKDAGLKLMEFLAGPDAQKIYAEQVFEYPVDPNVKPSDLVAGWGALKADALPLIDIAKNRKAASEMVDRVAFDDGAGS
ncbi:MAG: Fe(3+) ABC transporter substrate-binding protein [Rhizobiaceae bacterium]